jgi:sulfate/thiosulfate-binding protein
MRNFHRLAHTAAGLALALVAGCGQDRAPQSMPAETASTSVRTLTLAAYSSVQDVYALAILPAFRAQWRARTGEDVRFVDSYKASGAQSRAILAGFEADIAALALEPDLDILASEGLLHHDWKSAPHRGIVTRSLVVVGVHAGNPKRIHDWNDLARRDVELLMPDVRTSGGAMWYVLAILGAGHRGKIGGDDLPPSFLGKVLSRVQSLDKGTRDSVERFEAGEGDAILTYESEILAAQRNGISCEYVVPSSTILVENPVGIVDRWVEKHGNQDLAQAFLAFLFTPKVQAMFARDGFRPIDALVADAACSGLPEPDDLFTVGDLGGWEKVLTSVFGSGGAYDQAQGSRTPQR